MDVSMSETCRILVSVTANAGTIPGSNLIEYRCETHGIPMAAPSVHAFGGEALCPIGKIEKATAEALAAIAEAKK